MHEPADVFEADVAVLQLFMVQDAHAAVSDDLVSLEREVHFLDPCRSAHAPNAASAPGAPPLNECVGCFHARIIASAVRIVAC